MTPVDDSPDRVPCPYCAELVLPAARKCRYCSEWFEFADARPSALGVNDVRRTLEQIGLADSVLAEESGAPRDDLSDSLLRIVPILVEVGSDLKRMTHPRKGEMAERLADVRRRIALEFGVISPEVRTEVVAGRAPGAYGIRINGDLVAEGELFVDRVLGIGEDRDMPGVDVEHTTDPIYGTPAVWIPAKLAERAAQQGLQVFDPPDVLATHVAETIKAHLAEFMTREEVAELLNMARKDSPMVVQELVPNMLALGQLRLVLQYLVREQVPITDLSTILNALADNAVYTKDPHTLTEHVRAALARKICARYLSHDGLLRAFMLSPESERAIQGAIQLNESGQVLMLDPNISQAIQSNLGQALADNRGAMLDPIVITPPKIRRHVKALLGRNFANIVVLSYSDIVAGVQIENLATIEAHRSSGPHDADGRSIGQAIAEPASDWKSSDTTSFHARTEPSQGAWLIGEVDDHVGDDAEPGPSAGPPQPGGDSMDWNW